MFIAGCFWTMKEYQDFWKEMEVCKNHRADGKDGKCIDPSRQNLGCVGCPVDNRLYEPKPIDS